MSTFPKTIRMILFASLTLSVIIGMSKIFTGSILANIFSTVFFCIFLFAIMIELILFVGRIISPAKSAHIVASKSKEDSIMQSFIRTIFITLGAGIILGIGLEIAGNNDSMMPAVVIIAPIYLIIFTIFTIIALIINKKRENKLKVLNKIEFLHIKIFMIILITLLLYGGFHLLQSILIAK